LRIRNIAPLLMLATLTGAGLAQEYHDIPNGPGIPRGSVYAFENEIDVKGVRLGDTLADLDALVRQLQTEHGSNLTGSIDTQYLSATSRNGRNTVRFSYPEGLKLSLKQPDVTEGLEIDVGTPASGALVDHISRYTKYTGDMRPSPAATIEAVEQKYGEPTYMTPAGGTSMSHSLWYIWADGQLLDPVSKEEFYGAPYKCQQYIAAPYRFEHGIPLPEKCTAVLYVMVTVDQEDRVVTFSQSLFSGARHHDDRIRTDAAIADAINTTKTGGDLPQL